MSAKFKLIAIVVIGIFATAGTGLYMTQRPTARPISEISNQPSVFTPASAVEDIQAPERNKYKAIPLESISSVLQGSDPATLALNTFDNVVSERGTRKVEVVYPQPNQALVTITQDKAKFAASPIKYRVEMASFGRSLLVNSPPVWQIVWAGSQAQCLPGRRERIC
ncbi:MAG: hypothetical protein KME60_30305 [Cyanomargarita calcarea GSE-NOS-MK-12-04C]|jgi:hypothetical protein|uniref:Uncharacterized protein n=1 Tax=Cyanomargarita calcarea GSE-NOS-MK-12-04C TaxID=2839659 RepID=A0A951QVR2_9CYAN|nr:hypothetical protein [Cyanomargarita calcarea GSE-NOS-MK-12-04C]